MEHESASAPRANHLLNHRHSLSESDESSNPGRTKRKNPLLTPLFPFCNTWFMAYATQKGSYGKRPLWQWILLYIVIGAIVYGAVYYLYLVPKGGYNAPSSSPSQNSGY